MQNTASSNNSKEATIDAVDALHAHRGLVCFTGAGGKKSAMYHLAGVHPGRVALTSTVHMHPYNRRIAGAVVIVDGEDAEGIPAQFPDARIVAFAREPRKPKRVGGLTIDQVHALSGSAEFDVCLVKADGARGRLIKAPAEYEPVVPPRADTVVPVVSAGVFGRPLDDRISHRHERAGALAGLGAGESVLPRHVARLMAHPDAALKGIDPSAVVVPLINMADDERRIDQAREAAMAALSQTRRFDRVVIASLRLRGIVELVER